LQVHLLSTTGVSALFTHQVSDLPAVLAPPPPPRLQDPSQPGPMLTSTLQKSNTQTLKLYHKTPAAVTVSNATAAAVRRYIHAQQQKQQQQQQQVSAAGRGLPVIASSAAAAAGAESDSSGTAAAAAVGILDELQLMLVRQRLAAVVAWRDAAARAGMLCVWGGGGAPPGVFSYSCEACAA
jgi:hypothetical protein